MRRRRGYRRYKFTEKTQSKRGIAALIMALLSLLSFGIMALNAFRLDGNLSIYIACYGILAWILAIVAVILAVRSLKEEETFRTIPYAATGLSIITALIWSAVYIGGIVL